MAPGCDLITVDYNFYFYINTWIILITEKIFMKIWIVTDGLNMIPLFEFLNKYEFDYQIYWDWNNFPYGDKDLDHVMDCVEKWIKNLLEKWVKYIVLPPIFELHFSQKYPILPLFSNYLSDECLKYSIVWKIWFAWDWLETNNIDKYIKPILDAYELTPNQSKIKKFQNPFAIWKKEMTMWKYYLLKLWFRSWMVNRSLTHDLRYFKDAGVDTIVPLNYGYIAFDRIICKKLNFKKIRFHGIEKLSNVFDQIVQKYELKSDKYAVNLFMNWNVHILESEKKWTLLLTRGSKIQLQMIKI